MSQDLGLPVRAVEETLLGAERTLTRTQVADRAGVPLELAEELWQQLGFPHAADDDVAFSEADVVALALTHDLIGLGVLTPDSQSALVRTWGRSFARLAEWQVGLLARLAVEGEDPAARLTALTDTVLPDVERLQAYVWRRHLAGAAARLLEGGTGTTAPSAVGFVDIVGFTGHSRDLTDRELVAWVELFESHLTPSVVETGGGSSRPSATRCSSSPTTRRPPSRSRSPPPSAAPTPRTRSRRSAPGSRTARSWAGSVTCSGRPSTSPPA